MSFRLLDPSLDVIPHISKNLVINGFVMNTELAIKIDYLQKRKNPAQVFEAMGLYINAYQDLCQLLANAVDLEIAFELELNSVDTGSIISKLGSVGSSIANYIEEALYSSGSALSSELMHVSETGTEAEVNSIASALEADISKKIPETIVPPHIDRQGLAYVLTEFSNANKRLQSGEIVQLGAANSEYLSAFNTEWRFSGDASKMFIGDTSDFNGKDKLYTMVQVNEGNSVWSFKSAAMERKFPAKIVDKDWLHRYQSGLIAPIGPLDIMDAEISYSIYTPPDGKGRPQIRRAKIHKILSIHRNRDYQNALDV